MLLLLHKCVAGYSLLLRNDKVVHKSYLFLFCFLPFALASLVRWYIFFLNYSSTNPLASRYRFRRVFRSTLLFDSIMKYLILHQIIKQRSCRLSSSRSRMCIILLLLLPVSIEIATEHLHHFLFIPVCDRFSSHWWLLLLSFSFECSRCGASVAAPSSGLGPMGCLRLRGGLGD
jgi:hypothetical protein